MSDMTPEISTPIAEDAQAADLEPQVDEIPEDDGTDDVDKLRAAAQKARREARNLRERSKAAEAELAEYRAWKESQKTAEEKRQEEYEATVARNAELERAVKVRDLAAEHGLKPEHIKALSLMHGASDEDLAEVIQTFKAAEDDPARRVNPGQRIFSGGDPKASAAEAFFGAGLI